MFGVVILITGAFLTGLSFVRTRACGSDSYLSTDFCIPHINLCFTGLIFVIIGILLLMLAIHLDKIRKEQALGNLTICPECKQPITYENSPLNCFICGARIDWSLLEPRKW